MASVLEFLQQIRGSRRLGAKRKHTSIQPPSRSGMQTRESPDPIVVPTEGEEEYKPGGTFIEERAAKVREANLAQRGRAAAIPRFPTLDDADIRARIIRERIKRIAGVGPGRSALLGTAGGQRGIAPTRPSRRARPRTAIKRSLPERLRI